ncbi:MAG: DNA adenine methylase [Euryarchaeota archaeon]|nr:DNA adenine methylase [Euryarchaeota archaeon]
MMAKATPFLKWAGGKRQLLDKLSQRLPQCVRETGRIERYIEPFLGGGAMFFHLQRNFDIRKSFLFDINRELIIGYRVIQNDAPELIALLRELEGIYLDKSEKEREKFYYEMRDRYNTQIRELDYGQYNTEWIVRASYLIFLNKTCYNGLFRQNQKGEFNVPFGRYKNPSICDENNIHEVHSALKGTEITCGDFTESENCIEEKSLVYLDPPYRPISKTSSFTGYAKGNFTDEDQKRLAEFFVRMDGEGAFLLLSNSDPKNEDPTDTFFDELYSLYTIERVPAKRYINCDASGRGEINELVIRSY